ncbi:unnamed protein product [Ectocarpus sp. 12 AP-2014]
MKEWFLRFSMRDQLALLMLAAALGLYILIMLVFRPLGQARAELDDRNHATAEALVRVDELVTQVRALRSNGGARPQAASRNLTELINDSAESFGLAINRLQPNSRGAVQLRFETVSLESLLRWLHRLETAESVLVEELSISQTANAGVVGASVRVAAAR